MFRGFDLMPVFFAAILAFVTLGALQFAKAWPAAERGLVIFEKTCPIYAAHDRT